MSADGFLVVRQLDNRRRTIHFAQDGAAVRRTIYHGIGALEAVARDLSGDTKATLGEVLKRNPGLLPKPLDSALFPDVGLCVEQGAPRRGRTRA